MAVIPALPQSTCRGSRVGWWLFDQSLVLPKQFRMVAAPHRAANHSVNQRNLGGQFPLFRMLGGGPGPGLTSLASRTGTSCAAHRRVLVQTDRDGVEG